MHFGQKQVRHHMLNGIARKHYGRAPTMQERNVGPKLRFSDERFVNSIPTESYLVKFFQIPIFLLHT